jgi:ribonuclease Z
MERETPLEVYGPEGTQAMTNYILKAYQEDIKSRLYGLEPANNQGWRVNVHEISEGIIYRDENIKVEAFLVHHGSWPNAFGFRFTTPDKVIVISGDTAPCENIRYYSKGADILIHEVYFQQPFQDMNDSWKSYHASHHTSTHELAKLAQEICPGLLILYHILFWGGTEQDIINEIAEIYNGAVVVGSDLQVFE